MVFLASVVRTSETIDAVVHKVCEDLPISAEAELVISGCINVCGLFHCGFFCRCFFLFLCKCRYTRLLINQLTFSLRFLIFGKIRRAVNGVQSQLVGKKVSMLPICRYCVRFYRKNIMKSLQLGRVKTNIHICRYCVNDCPLISLPLSIMYHDQV